MDEMVKVSFQGKAEVSIGGEMSIPKSMWEAIPDDCYWSVEIDKHIKERIDSTHFDMGSVDDHDVSLDDVTLSHK